MTINSETTISENLAINFPAARKPPQGSTRFWPRAVGKVFKSTVILQFLPSFGHTRLIVKCGSTSRPQYTPNRPVHFLS